MRVVPAPEAGVSAAAGAIESRGRRRQAGLPRAATPWPLALLCAAGLALDAVAFWPGQVSFDTAYAWWQARGGEHSDIVPPLFVLALRAAQPLVEGPGLVFLLHAALFWSGLGLLARARRASIPRALAALLLIGLAPAPWLLRGHVWTDVGMLGALSLASGTMAMAMAAAGETGRRVWLLACLPPLLYAACMRHNALPAILPFSLLWALLAARELPRQEPAGTLRPLALAAVLLLAAVGLGRLLSAQVERQVPLWPSLAQFDLAALSIARDELLLPPFLYGPGLDVAELAEAFRPWSNLPMLQHTRHGMRSPFDPPFSPRELDALRDAWLAGLRAAPGAWLAHRWRLSRALFGTHRPEWPRALIYVDAAVPYADNPPLPANRGPLHRAVMASAERLRASAALAAWPYLGIGLLVLPWAWRRRNAADGRLALVLLASAWLHALPLAALAPAAELRYLGWPCSASLLAVASLWLPKFRSSTRKTLIHR